MRRRQVRHLGSAPARQGTILIVTMWIVLVLAGLVLVLARAMRVEAVCSANETSCLQADAVEQGAIQYVLSRVDSLQGELPDEADTPCQAVRIGAGAFWIVRPDFDDDHACAYGIVDEASKVNVNHASQAMLLKIPDMTDELAACLADWRDGDSDISPGGAESEYYLLGSDPYECKNAPLETVEEMFLVKGADEQILFGEDANRNGVLDANEDDGDACEPPDNRDGRLDRGVAPFVTVYTAEPSTDSGGQPRVNVNDAQGQALSDVLRQSMSADRVAAVMDLARRRRPFRNVLDFYVRTGLTLSEFQPIADQLTAGSQNVLSGLINVNTAPREVLACLPGLDDNDVSSLLARRSDTSTDVSCIAWVAEALRPSQGSANDAFIQKVAGIGSLITVRSFQFSADIVSLSGDGRAFRRCRVVVDATSSPPKVIYRQDLTHLGWPLSPDIMAKARSGGGIEDVAAGQTIRQEVSR